MILRILREFGSYNKRNFYTYRHEEIMDNQSEDILKKTVEALGRHAPGLSVEAASIFLLLGDGEDQENGYSLSQALGFASVRVDTALGELTQKNLVEVVDTDMIPQLVTLTEQGFTVKALMNDAVMN